MTMFAALQTEVGSRAHTLTAYFDAIAPEIAIPTTAAAGLPLQVAKGTAFVLLYAIYEFAVNELFRAALAEARKHNLQFRDTRLELLTLGLHPEITAVANCGPRRTWEARLKMLLRSSSADAFTADESVFPVDGSHYREQQLETLWRIFGMTPPILPHPRYGTLIEELVENRNAIAHGRKTAEDVGSGYSAEDIRRKISETQGLCFHLCAAMQAHCSTPANLRR